MRKLTFPTLFSRMLCMQCLCIFSILLVVCCTVLIAVRAQKVQDETELLSDKASAVIEEWTQTDRETYPASDACAKEYHLLIQVIFDIEAHSFYTDACWEPLASLQRPDTNFSAMWQRAGETAEHTNAYFRGNNTFTVLTVYRTFVRDDGRVGLILLHSDVSGINGEMRELLLWMLVILILAAVIAVLLSYYTSYRIIHPFVEMNRTVQCFSKGDFSQRVSVSGKDEAAQLGRSFNEMAEQLKNLEDTRRSFVANVSHELRSPLTSMNGFLEAMQDGTIPEEDHAQYIGIVLSETKRMNAMVNDLLDLARIESGIIVLHREVFDINELIRRVIITFEARISEKDLSLDIRFAQEQCFVDADVNQISQVLRNLIDNAIKYSPAGSKVGVSTYAIRKDVFVNIRDTGMGIPQEDVPHVFDRFYKVEKAHTPSPQVGSGLGLSIVKRIIEQHGQSITVRSARGKGTQFTFTLARVNPPRRATDGGK